MKRKLRAIWLRYKLGALKMRIIEAHTRLIDLTEERANLLELTCRLEDQYREVLDQLSPPIPASIVLGGSSPGDRA